MKKEQKKFVYLDFNTHRSIKILSVEKNTTIQDLINEILIEWLENNK